VASSVFPLLINIPAYNEEKRFPTEEYINFLLKVREGVDFQFINDGSIDNTQTILLNLKNKFPERIYIKVLKKNVGKAEALRFGILDSKVNISNYKYIGYFDADLAAPLNEIFTFDWWFQKLKSKPMIFIGSRVKLFGTTNIKRYVYRHYLGRFFATIVSNCLKLTIYDTQCGAKLFSDAVVKDLFKDAFISRWLFDVELIFRFINMFGCKNLQKMIYEIPLLRWEEKGHSKIRVADLIKMPYELARITTKYNNCDESGRQKRL
jgi:glycosyltransferase involved in cell wall biosynthesis